MALIDRSRGSLSGLSSLNVGYIRSLSKSPSYSESPAYSRWIIATAETA